MGSWSIEDKYTKQDSKTQGGSQYIAQAAAVDVDLVRTYW